MLNLLSFFEPAEEGGNTNGWITWVILGVLVVAMILMMIIPQRRQKKRTEEMMSRLTVGAVVTTIGGIVGEVVAMDEQHIWLLTGVGENKSTIQFVRQAIHAVAAASSDTEFAPKQQEAKADEEDEIK